VFVSSSSYVGSREVRNAVFNDRTLEIQQTTVEIEIMYAKRVLCRNNRVSIHPQTRTRLRSVGFSALALGMSSQGLPVGTSKE
jgi:hypothetical protein